MIIYHLLRYWPPHGVCSHDDWGDETPLLKRVQEYYKTNGVT